MLHPDVEKQRSLTLFMGFSVPLQNGLTLRNCHGTTHHVGVTPKTTHCTGFNDASLFNIDSMIPSRPGSSLGERRQSISSNGPGRASLGASGRSSFGAGGRSSIGGAARASMGVVSSGIPRPPSRVSLMALYESG